MLEKLYKRILSEKIIEIIKKNKKYKKMFIVSVFLFNLSLYSIPLLLFHLEIIKVPREFIVSFTKFLYDLELLKIDKKLEDNIIIVKNFRFYIDQQCLGIKSILGTLAIILATPITSLKKKARYLLITLPIVFLVNILRIYSTIYLFYFFDLNPYIVHDVLWEILNFLFILTIWYLFYRKTKKEIILSS